MTATVASATVSPEATAPRARRVAAERPALSAERIVRVATELIERDGLDAFTMRALGRELGVSAMAVYGYFPSREQVLAAVLERFMASMDTAPVPGERWDDTLRRTMTSLYQYEKAHPQMARIDVSPDAGPEGLAAHTERIISQYVAQGMPECLLARLWAMVDAYLTGFIENAIAVSEAACDVPGADADAPLWERIVAEAYTDEAFAYGVEIIIEGIRALAAPDPCEWRTPTEPTAPR